MTKVLTEKQKILKNYLTDRMIAEERKFRQKNTKTEGNAAGYVAVKLKDASGLPFMIKIATKGDAAIRNDNYDTMCFVNEFISAAFYKRTLYDRTPIIDGVVTMDQQQVALRSKFLHDFQTVSQFTNGLRPNSVGDQYAKLQQVEGTEKVFAAMLAWGEHDIHSGNLGVMKITDDMGKDKYVMSKIDHGFSATQFFTDPSFVLENFAAAYELYGYEGALPMNVTKLKEALDQITNISDEEIEDLVRTRMFKLKSMKLELNDLAFVYAVNSTDHTWDEGKTEFKIDTFTNFQKLEEHYINNYKKQIAVMREVSKSLGIISRISPVTNAWKDGQWLLDIRGQNPEEWAKKNGKTINALVSTGAPLKMLP